VATLILSLLSQFAEGTLCSLADDEMLARAYCRPITRASAHARPRLRKTDLCVCPAHAGGEPSRCCASPSEYVCNNSGFNEILVLNLLLAHFMHPKGLKSQVAAGRDCASRKSQNVTDRKVAFLNPCLSW